MILIAITIIIFIILIIKIEIKFILNNKNLKINLIIFRVIKINLKAKAIKRGEKFKSSINDFKNIKNKDILNIANVILHKAQYLFSKMLLNLNVKCDFYILSPDKTAILYGVISSFIYNMEKILINEFKIYKGAYYFNPDFATQKNNIEIEVYMSIRNIYIIIFVIKTLPMMFKYKKLLENKGGELNGSSNRRSNENYNG